MLPEPAPTTNVTVNIERPRPGPWVLIALAVILWPVALIGALCALSIIYLALNWWAIALAAVWLTAIIGEHVSQLNTIGARARRALPAVKAWPIHMYRRIRGER